MATQLSEIPALAAEDADLHFRQGNGIDLAGHGEDEGGLAAAVGAEDGDVLAGADGEVDVVKDDAIAARDVDVAQVEKMARIDLRGLLKACISDVPGIALRHSTPKLLD